VSSISSGSGGTLLGGLSSSGLLQANNSNGRPTLSGLASGLDTNLIIQDLLASQQAQITALQNKESVIQGQQSAWQQIQADLANLQNDAAALAQPQQSVFDNRNVASSNPNLVTGAASASATPGTYSLTVNKVAAANEIASQGFSSASAQITQGTFQIGSGTGAPATITINATNNTLQGLASAINNANAGVTASIVNDGSGNANQPYRLVLTATQTGTANAIHITNGLAADNGGATQPVFNATYIGAAETGAGYTGTSVPTANTGAGTYTGTTNDTYTFTVVNGGTVGTDNGITLSYANSTGSSTGTITLNSSDVNTFKNVANGLQVEFATGTLVAGQTFGVKTYVPTVQQAADASVTVGSGTGALTIQNSSNQIDNLIPGVTVDLQGAAPNTPVILTVTNDTTQAATAIQNFVNDFNSLTNFIGQQISFDSTTKAAGTLQGDPQISQIQNQLRNVLDSAVSGVNANANNLSAIGITFTQNGQLQLNQATLNSALAGNISGVSLGDVQSLFGLAGSSPNTGVTFITADDKTQASGGVPYQVNITQAAQQASITATSALASPAITIDNTNNTLSLTVNGTASGTITLASGTYTQATLAQEIQKEINAQSSLQNDPVTVGVNNSNQLTITTGSFGSASNIKIGSGTALSTLGFAGTETGTGKDVQGSFTAHGVTETATGNGQILTGTSTNSNTADLVVRVTLTPQQVGSGAQASLTVTRGVASSLSVVLDNLLNPVNGQLSTINNGFQTSEDNINQQITQINTSMQTQQAALLTQFTAMEQAVSQLQSIGSFLNMTFNNNSNSSQQSKL
jgi:flagellar hook-associated protein 2